MRRQLGYHAHAEDKIAVVYSSEAFAQRAATVINQHADTHTTEDGGTAPPGGSGAEEAPPGPTVFKPPQPPPRQLPLYCQVWGWFSRSCGRRC